MLRTAIVAASLLLAVPGWAAPVAPLQPPVVRGDAQSFLSALTALKDKLGDTARASPESLPMRGSAVFAQAEAQADAMVNSFGTPQWPVTSVDEQKALCALPDQIYRSYEEVGIAIRANTKLPKFQNFVRFFPEVSPFFVAGFHCSASVSVFIETWVKQFPASDPRVVLGKKQLQKGSYDTLGGYIGILKNLDDAKVPIDRLSEVLIRDASAASLAISMADRASIRAQIVSARVAGSPNLRKTLAAVGSSIATTPCGEVCSTT